MTITKRAHASRGGLGPHSTPLHGAHPGAGTPSTLRCAVYTRKSSEEGLDMAFNSLDAQREAGLDYIKSQRSQGWIAVPTMYDDGGFSGGNTDRPGLQRLLADIKAQRVDTVVVYKVDRLSRSLTDFARLMQLFDEHQVSFVSVTQQFNTTTSMGRLTLNMLLSFAQFEREVTGERIRDKIAATKRKGIFVAGQPPLGYRRPTPDDSDAENRILRIVPEQAAIIRRIYALYLEGGSPLDVARTLNAEGITSRRWTSTRERPHGGSPWNSASVHRVLSNPIYIGMIVHTRGRHLPPGRGRGPTEMWQGLHQPIIDRETWDRVRALMDREEPKVLARWTHTYLLKGKLRTLEGFAMSPTSTNLSSRKGTSDGRRKGKLDGKDERVRAVRYYVSQKAAKQGYRTCPIGGINGNRIDELVRALMLDRLEGSHGLTLDGLEPEVRDHWLRELLLGMVLAIDHVRVTLRTDPIRACAEAVGATLQRATGTPTTRRCYFTPEVDTEGTTDRTHEVLMLRLRLKDHDGRRAMISPDGEDLMPRLASSGKPEPSPQIVRAIGQAYALHEELMSTRETIEAVAARRGLDEGRARYLLRLTRLSPTVLRAALTGSLSSRVTLADLNSAAGDLDWSLQASRLGLGSSPKSA